MATNEFLPFATAGGANVLTPAEWSALASRLTGWTAGVAKSEELNKAWRQSSVIATVIGQFVADQAQLDALDDGDTAKLLDRFKVGVRRQGLNYFPSVSGTANDIVITMTPAPASYGALLGTPIRFGPSGRNTGNTTVNINGLGAKQIIRRGGTALQPGDLVAGEIAEIIYDGANFQLFVVPAGFRNLVVFSANGSFTVPAGVRRLHIELWGGGGGGGGSIGASSAALAGAGGGYSHGLFDVTPGDVYAVTIGSGGSGGTSGSFGGPGTTTSVGALISATGGGGGTGSNNAGIINGGTTGGGGFGGQVNIAGFGGGSGYASGTLLIGAPGGGSFCVPGTPPSFAPSNPGAPAISGFYPAGGGNGGCGTQAGGGGSAGLVLIRY